MEESRERNEVRKELEELAPELLEYKKSVDYEVPEGYFDQLPEVVLSRVNTRKTSRIRQLVVRTIAAAAAIALLVVFVKGPAANDQDALAGIGEDELLNYVSENLDAYSGTDIYALLGDETLFAMPEADTENSEEMLDAILDGLDEETLNTYLQTQNLE